MGGRRYKPSGLEATIIQILCFILLIFLPIVWVASILYGFVKMLLSPSNAIAMAKYIATSIATVTMIPFVVTFTHIGLLFGRSVGYNEDGYDDEDEFDVDPNRADSMERPVIRRLAPTAGWPETSEGAGAAPVPPNSYQYQQLNGVDEFRLLVISPGSFDDALHGEVIIVKFSGIGRPAYEALSYTWADETGDDKRSCEFLCSQDHSIIRITQNCEAAIRRLRLPNRKRWVWIDAICIDQSSATERTHQVRMMSKIYMDANRVVVYTGEGTNHTNILFDWLNGLKTEDLDILLKWDLDNLAVDTAISFERYWTIGKERLFALFSDPDENRIELSQPELVELAREFFSRRWFQRVWVLQEVSLPDPRNTIVMCGTKSTTAIRALHALSLIYNDSAGTMIRIFVLLRKQMCQTKVKKSHLLDILIETRHREAGDPRDKIFGILSIASYLDKGMFPELKARYTMTTAEVYEYYSTFFIRHHGPGFFLSLIKHPRKIPALPSWAADWTVPWPNYKAVEGRDFAAAARPSNDGDADAIFTTEYGHHVLTLHRPEILQGYLTRNGHIDDEKDTRVEQLDDLRKDEILIEIYPGLAALLRQKDDLYHEFVQICPHALSEDGVKELVSRWSTVVVDGEGPKASGTVKYLGPVEPFSIQ